MSQRSYWRSKGRQRRAGVGPGVPEFLVGPHGADLILNDLFVAPGARRRGVGRLLLDAVAVRARAAGACRVVLSTAQDNNTAKSLYHAAGYRLDGAFDHYEVSLQ